MEETKPRHEQLMDTLSPSERATVTPLIAMLSPGDKGRLDGYIDGLVMALRTRDYPVMEQLASEALANNPTLRMMAGQLIKMLQAKDRANAANALRGR